MSPWNAGRCAHTQTCSEKFVYRHRIYNSLTISLTISSLSGRLREQLQKPRGPAYGLVSDWRFLRGAASCSSGGVTRAPRCMQLPARLGCTCRRAFDAPFGVANPSKSAIAAKFRPRKTRIRHIQREYLHFYAAKHARRRTRRQYFQSCAACSQLLRVMPGAAACVQKPLAKAAGRWA